LKAKMFNTRLFFLISPAMIGLLLFASFIIKDNLNTQKNTKKIGALIQLSIINSELVHELQKERGMSRGSISPKGKNFSQKLAEQRAKTDQTISKHQRVLPDILARINNASIELTLQKVAQELARLRKFRGQIDAQAISAKALIGYYSEINADLINIILPTIKLANKDKLTNLLQTYYNLVQAKELAGLERALVAGILNSASITAEQKKLYISLVAVQSSYLKTFSQIASKAVLQFFNQAMEHPSSNEVLRLRKAIMGGTTIASIEADSVQWFDSATLRINQLKKVEDQIVSELQHITYQLTKKAESILLFSLLYSLLAIGLTLLLLFQLIKSHHIQKQQQQQLDKFGLVVENTPNAVLITDKDDIIEYTNKQFTLMTGYESHEVIGKKPRMLQSDQTQPELYDEIKNTVNKGQQWHGELLNQRKDHSQYWAKTKIFPVLSPQGEIKHIIGLQEDVTEQKAAQEKIKYLAHYDELTGLPSLRLGKDRLKQAILSAQRHKLTMAVMFIDLDGFKEVNDIYGHAAGDLVLKEVSARMVSILRNTDTVARIGGDEFMAILTNVKQKDGAGANIFDKIAGKMVNTISQPIAYQDKELTISSSIGIALSPQDGLSSSDLLHKADEAMYQVKKSGKNGFKYYQQESEP